MSKISIGQVGELIRKDGRNELGGVSSEDLQWLMEEGNWAKLAALRGAGGLPVTYDQSIGLGVLIEHAVGERNLGNINSDITPERFKLSGTGVRKMSFRVEPYLSGETSEQVALRLTTAGHTLGDIGDLAGFLHDHPKEVEKWGWVLAISESSRWAYSDGRVCVPYALVDGSYRYFRLHAFRFPLDPCYGVLVACE